MFSRVSAALEGPSNSLYVLRAALEAEGRTVTDLVSGNVNEHGILFPQDELAELLAAGARQSAIYRPDSIGQPAARLAVSGYYRERGVELPAEHIVLTP